MMSSNISNATYLCYASSDIYKSTFNLAPKRQEQPNPNIIQQQLSIVASSTSTGTKNWALVTVAKGGISGLYTV